MNRKLYRIDYDWKAELIVEIDHIQVTDEKILSIFLGLPEAERKNVKGVDGTLNTLLKILCRRVLRLQIERHCLTEEIIQLFDVEKGYGQLGWPKMDGTEGFKIVHVDSFDFNVCGMKVEAA